MRLVFLGSPADVIAPLESLLELGREGVHTVVGVVSQPAKPAGRKKKLTDPPLATFAKEHGLKVMQPTTIRDPEFLKELRELKPDVAITAAYGKILTDDFLNIPSRATINIHPSLLPRYRGATPVPAALLDGLEVTGVTILFTVRELDAGAIILQEEAVIQAGETAGALAERLFRLGGALLKPALAKLADPEFSGVPQDEAAVTLCRKIDKEDGRIDWRLPAQVLENRFRAYSPWPGSYTAIGDKRVVITDLTRPDASDGAQTALKPGEFIYDKRTKRLLVGTGDGALAIGELKPAGSKEQDAASFWNGLRETGDRGQFA